ncbi:NAD(P)-binding protein [Nocardioides terrisoli]|uniref:NAD(P)-binding protein n=1 Tax=Nocardioides terrisoli TaxID=3388267 RepID=UPI0037C71228
MGAGIAGCSAAITLATRGVEVTQVEKQAEWRPTSRWFPSHLCPLGTDIVTVDSVHTAFVASRNPVAAARQLTRSRKAVRRVPPSQRSAGTVTSGRVFLALLTDLWVSCGPGGRVGARRG